MEKGRNLFMSLDKVRLLLDVFSRKLRFLRYFCKELLYRISGVARFLDGRGELNNGAPDRYIVLISFYLCLQIIIC